MTGCRRYTGSRWRENTLSEKIRSFDRQVWTISLSPDQKWFLLSDYTSPGSGWGLVSPDGKEYKWLKDYLLPEWSPDGKQLIVQKAKTLALIDPVTATEKETELLKWVTAITGVWYIQPGVK